MAFVLLRMSARCVYACVRMYVIISSRFCVFTVQDLRAVL